MLLVRLYLFSSRLVPNSSISLVEYESSAARFSRKILQYRIPSLGNRKIYSHRTVLNAS